VAVAVAVQYQIILLAVEVVLVVYLPQQVMP
jgi:hypothetical protein